jgi:hypothetical protein
MTKRKKAREVWYTVVGFHKDNDQPTVDWTKGCSPGAAARRTMADRLAKGEDISVVEVFKGKQRGCLCNDEIADSPDSEELQKGESRGLQGVNNG